MNNRESFRNVMTLVGGAGIGALAIYFLDPNKGAQRRQHAAERANEAFKNLQETLGPTLEVLSEKAGELGRSAVTGVSTFGQNIADQVSDLTERLASGEMGQNLAQRASNLGETSSQQFRSLLQKTGLSSRQPPAPGVGQKLAALGLVALGAGTMYLLDPATGKGRRVLISDKVRATADQFRRNAIRRGVYLWNRTSGTVSEMKLKFSREQPDDRVLAERVRSEIGRCVSTVGAIDVRATSGRVILSGPVLASEIDGLLKCAWSVPGVKELINQLQSHQEPGNVPDLQGAKPQSTGATPQSTTSESRSTTERFD